MESSILTIVITFTTIFASLLSFYYLSLRKKVHARKKSVPCVPGAWPILGHLHLLGVSDRPMHQMLMSMAEKYGPIFTLKVGARTTLIVSDMDLAKECFTINDQVFATRPKSIAVEILAYNYSTFAMAPYGPFWRQMRKLSVAELLSNNRLQKFSKLRVSEVKLAIRQMFETWNKLPKGEEEMVKVDLGQWLGGLTLNLILKIIAGKRFLPSDEQGIKIEKTLKNFMEFLGAFVVADAIPSLRWLDLGGYEKAMRITHKEVDDTLQAWLDEHRESRTNMNSGKQEDFIDVILSLFEGESSKEPLPPGFDVDKLVKALCLTIVVGAHDTTLVTLTWAVTLLLNNPGALKKAQQEIDEHVGKERQVEESDMKNFIYLQAIIKETLRLYPAAPLLIPHESMEECTVGGYNISKGTTLLVNSYTIHRDPRVWSDPTEFRPERFLTGQKEFDVGGQNFEWMPFGIGRRMCPGINFGVQAMDFTLASLIHGFELENLSAEPMDMKEGFGITIHKATPLEVVLRPRLSPDLYT